MTFGSITLREMGQRKKYKCRNFLNNISQLFSVLFWFLRQNSNFVSLWGYEEGGLFSSLLLLLPSEAAERRGGGGETF